MRVVNLSGAAALNNSFFISEWWIFCLPLAKSTHTPAHVMKYLSTHVTFAHLWHRDEIWQNDETK